MESGFRHRGTEDFPAREVKPSREKSSTIVGSRRDLEHRAVSCSSAGYGCAIEVVRSIKDQGALRRLTVGSISEAVHRAFCPNPIGSRRKLEDGAEIEGSSDERGAVKISG